MRWMIGLSPWSNASAMFVRYRVCSFKGVMQIATNCLLDRVFNSENMIIVSLNGSDEECLVPDKSRLG